MSRNPNDEIGMKREAVSFVYNRSVRLLLHACELIDMITTSCRTDR